MNFSFIPQVFYDLIARLIPGSILLWCSYIIYFGCSICVKHIQSLLNKKWEINFFLIAQVFLVAYILSIILSGIWTLIGKLRAKKVSFFLKEKCIIWTRTNDSIKEDIKKTINSRWPGCIEEDFEIPSASFVYDFLRLKVPEVGARLVKVRAECHMCSVLLIGWLVLSILNILNFFSKLTEAIIIEIVLILCIIGIFLFLKNLEERFVAALSNYWVLHKLNLCETKDNEKTKTG